MKTHHIMVEQVGNAYSTQASVGATSLSSSEVGHAVHTRGLLEGSRKKNALPTTPQKIIKLDMADNSSNAAAAEASNDDAPVANISLQNIIDGTNERSIPKTKFIDDIDMFSGSFDPPASSELLIGAYSDLHSKFKQIEQQLTEKKAHREKSLPEIEKSIKLVRHLKQKKEDGDSVVTRYNLADIVYAKAEVDCSQGTVNLWLGADVMLEYTYEDALELLTTKESKAKQDFEEVC